MPDPKTEQLHNQTIHYSVGAVIERYGKFLLIDRAKPPFGFAGLAGHVDTSEEPEDALIREVKEESSLEVISTELLCAEFVEWNECSRGVKGHFWYLYRCEVAGEVQIDSREEKSIGWVATSDIKNLQLEPVWEYWFKKLGIIVD